MKAWRLADITYLEDQYREADLDLFGGRLDMSSRETCFCWCFWSYSVSVLELQNADSILVRSMDEAMMCQPRDMYWSVLGMMNNPWFRVAIDKSEGTLRFEHPTSLLPGPSGWMEKVKKAGGDLLNGRWGEKAAGSDEPLTPPPEEVSMMNQGATKVFTLEEFKSQSSQKRPLFVVKGQVYDGTAYLAGHPGGAQSILAVAGTDATEEFMAIRECLGLVVILSSRATDINNHADSENAKGMMRDFHLGTLDDSGRQALQAPDDSEALSPTRAEFLDPRHWAKAVLSNIETISWDTKIFSFKLDHEDQVAGLPVGQHIMLRVKDPTTNDSIIRAYTPISDNAQRGTFDLLVKLYLPTPTMVGGKLTTVLDTIPLGTALEFKGPIGKFEYIGPGAVTISGARRNVSSFTMICGGSGITPIFQVFRAVMQDSSDKTFCTVLCGNRLEEDILCRQELDNLSCTKSDCCRVIHTLTRPPENWTGLTGRISESLLQAEAAATPGGLALICGPESMEQSVRKILLGLGWNENDLVFF
jgi:nitrate reductase (NAD(P)H)